MNYLKQHVVLVDSGQQAELELKDFAANILFAVGLIVAVIIWYGYSNNFSGEITAKDEYIPKAESLGNPAFVPPPPSADGTLMQDPALTPSASITAVVSKTMSAEEAYLRGSYCKTQHDALLKEKSHEVMVANRKTNPDKYDVTCFNFPGLTDAKAVANCLVGDKKASAAVSSVTDSVMCSAFLKVYQSYVADFLFPDDVDVKSLTQEILQKKIQAQLLKPNKNPQLMSEMVTTLVKSYPNDFDSLKLYVKAVGFGQKPDVYAEGGPLFNYIQQAYKLNPRDIEIREMYMYGIIHSANGDSKLLQIFPNVKEDPKLQALRYYYLAWAYWNKEDRVQALNNLEFAKSLAAGDARYSEAYEKVKNEANKPKAEGVFYLSFSLI